MLKINIAYKFRRETNKDNIGEDARKCESSHQKVRKPDIFSS